MTAFQRAFNSGELFNLDFQFSQGEEWGFAMDRVRALGEELRKLQGVNQEMKRVHGVWMAGRLVVVRENKQRICTLAATSIQIIARCYRSCKRVREIEAEWDVRGCGLREEGRPLTFDSWVFDEAQYAQLESRGKQVYISELLKYIAAQEGQTRECIVDSCYGLPLRQWPDTRDMALVSDESLAKFLSAPLSEDLTTVPGIGPDTRDKLAAGYNKVETTHQLIAMFLSFRRPGVTSTGQCDALWYYLRMIGISEHRSGIVLCVAEKVNAMLPGWYPTDVPSWADYGAADYVPFQWLEDGDDVEEGEVEEDEEDAEIDRRYKANQAVAQLQWEQERQNDWNWGSVMAKNHMVRCFEQELAENATVARVLESGCNF